MPREIEFTAQPAVRQWGRRLPWLKGWHAKSKGGRQGDQQRRSPFVKSFSRTDRRLVGEARSAANGQLGGTGSSWAALVKPVFEVDPLACPKCGSEMEVFDGALASGLVIRYSTS